MVPDLGNPKKRKRIRYGKYPEHSGRSGEFAQLRKNIMNSISLLGDNHWAWALVEGLITDLEEHPVSWDKDELNLFKALVQNRFNDRRDKVSKRVRKIDILIDIFVQAIDERLASCRK